MLLRAARTVTGGRNSPKWQPTSTDRRKPRTRNSSDGFCSRVEGRRTNHKDLGLLTSVMKRATRTTTRWSFRSMPCLRGTSRPCNPAHRTLWKGVLATLFRTKRCSLMCVAVKSVAVLCQNCVRYPPATQVKHRDLRGHSDAHCCCGKSLIASALVGFDVRQHARAESISKRAPSTTRTSLRL